MYRPVRPIFIGLKMKLIPANVNSGAPCSQPRLVHVGTMFGIIPTLRCRTSTPFGSPVVPDVYMMSAMSSGPTGTWNSLVSMPAISSSHPSAPSAGPSAHTIDRSEGTPAHTTRAWSSRPAAVNITEISA